jgi:hypothetical protein
MCMQRQDGEVAQKPSARMGALSVQEQYEYTQLATSANEKG